MRKLKLTRNVEISTERVSISVRRVQRFSGHVVLLLAGECSQMHQVAVPRGLPREWALPRGLPRGK